jgi:tRNA modification GTPase
MDPNDTIVALSSAVGPGARAVVRLTGRDAIRIALTRFAPTLPIDASRRQLHPGTIRLPNILSPLPAELIVCPAPRTYTGQQMAELHTVASPPLADLLVAELLNAGARAAGPGEFTMRAFLAGKRDLPRAEAVQAVISADNRGDLKQALAQLAGGVTRPLEGLRDDLLNLLADVEAGLDFTEEDIQFVDSSAVLARLTKGLAQLTTLRRKLEQRAAADCPFRAALVGAPNAGKSSLFNALGGAALVSPTPGTTRDYLVNQLEIDGITIELIDTAGSREPSDAVEHQSQDLGSKQAADADVLLLCVEAGCQPPPAWGAKTVLIATKCDLGVPPAGTLATSVATGLGLPELRSLLAGHAKSRAGPALAPSLSRCRHHVDAALDHLRKAHSTVLFEDPAEVLALELRGALDQLGEMVGAVYTDDLLDRIFSRFCIGK